MRRAILGIVVLLIGGAVVNVGVAWWCAVWNEELGIRVVEPPPTNVIAERWYRVASGSWPSPPTDSHLSQDSEFIENNTGVTYQKSPGADSLILYVFKSSKEDRSDMQWTEWYFSCGLPLRCFEGDIFSEGNVLASPGFVVPRSEKNCIRLKLPAWLTRNNSSNRSSLERVCPTGPIFLGLFVNTAVYALILGAIFLTLSTLRSVIRGWRGRCTKCGYPVGESAVCTECGAEVMGVRKS